MTTKLNTLQLKLLLQGVSMCPKEYRLGQAIFNILLSIHPELAEEIRSTEYDPFYKEDVSKCMDYILDEYAKHQYAQILIANNLDKENMDILDFKLILINNLN
jgi:hypothetical protein